MVAVKINGTDVEALLDTGAGISVISSTFAESILEVPDPLGLDDLPGVVVADGAFLKATGVLNVLLQIGEELREHAQSLLGRKR